MKHLKLMLLLTSLAGCSGLPNPLANSLEGTIGSSEDLNFDEVQVRRFATGEIEVRYVRNKDGNSEVVAKVTVKTPTEGISYGREIELLSNDGVISRAVQDAEDFPELKSGSITIDAGGIKAGDATRGKFAAVFMNDKTIKGTFEADLTMVE